MIAWLAPLAFALGAFAAKIPRVPAACGQFLVTASAGRPIDPRAVDPEDEYAILKFIESIVRLPSTDVPHGLRDGWIEVWRVFRPDLNSDQLKSRVRLFNGSRFAHARLLSRGANRRSEVGRVRLVWLDFLRDVAPDRAVDFEALDHRARALMVTQRAGPIAKFLSEELKLPVTAHVESAAGALGQLYRRHLGGVAVEPARPTVPHHLARHAEICRLWGIYVAGLTTYRAQMPRVRQAPKMRFKHRDQMPADPRAVPLDPEWIVEFLVLRITSLRPTQLNAPHLYFTALRAEYGLPPVELALLPNDFRYVRRAKNFAQSQKRLRDAWDIFLADLRRKEAE